MLKPANQSLSLLSAWLRVVYAAILAIALNNLLDVLQLLTGTGYLALATDQLHAQVMLFAGAFRNGWDLGLVLFGLHLIILGYLVFKSGYIPRWLGLLLVIAGLGYFIDGIGKILLPTYNLSLALYTFIGEPVFMFYLLWKGIKGFDKSLEQKN